MKVVFEIVRGVIGRLLRPKQLPPGQYRGRVVRIVKKENGVTHLVMEYEKKESP